MIKHNHGSTGIGGVAYYAAEQFPPEYRDTVFIGNPVTGRVNHDRLEQHGSTYQAIEQPDFIRCDDPWFRPVNLQLGPDGRCTSPTSTTASSATTRCRWYTPAATASGDAFGAWCTRAREQSRRACRRPC